MEQKSASSADEFREAEQSGVGLHFWPFCCLAVLPIMEEHHAASSADELHEAR